MAGDLLSGVLQLAALKLLGTEGVEGTFGAEGLEALADVATVEQQPVVGIGGFMVVYWALG